MGSGVRGRAGGAGSAQPAPLSLPGNWLAGHTMVIYGLARGGPVPWHPVCVSWQLAQPRLAPPAAIFKAPGLHPKDSALYFWCKMIFLGGGVEVFFFLYETHGFGGRERGRNSWAQLEKKQEKKKKQGELVEVLSRGRALLSSAPRQGFAHGSGITKAWAWFTAGVC